MTSPGELDGGLGWGLSLMHDGKLVLLPTALARLYALAMELDVNISTVDHDTGEVDAAVGAAVSPGIVMLDRSLDDDDGLHADILAFACLL